MTVYVKKVVAAEDVKAGMVVNAQRGWFVESVTEVDGEITILFPGAEIGFRRGMGHVLSTLVESTLEDALA